jgi:uncharacterized GH25 family protein
MKTQLTLLTLVGGLVLGSLDQVNAHSVWIEEEAPGGRLVVRFGEFGDEYETSPGHLDSLDAVVASSPGGTNDVKSVQTEKNPDFFDLKDLAKEPVVVVETGFPVMPSTGKPSRKPYFYARWWDGKSAVEKPMLTLDLLPTGKPGEVRVFFRNQPAADAKVTLYTPDANDVELVSDENGIVRFEVKETGLYMLKCGRYREDRDGFSAGQHFGLVSHNSSLTWRAE